ncbi:MAG: FixH family protein [Bacillota bacterium]
MPTGRIYQAAVIAALALFFFANLSINTWASPGKKGHEEPQAKQDLVAPPPLQDSARETEPQIKREYRVQLATTPSPLVKGKNKVSLYISTPEGQPVENVLVKGVLRMEPEMKGHGKMPAILLDLPFAAQAEPGWYASGAVLKHDGSWSLELALVYPDGQEQSFASDLAVIDEGPNKLVLAAFGSIIAGAILLAQVLKRTLKTSDEEVPAGE